MTDPVVNERPDPAVWGPFAKAPVAPFLLPLVAYMLLASFEPAMPDPDGAEADNWFGLTSAHYPLAYAVRLAISCAILAYCWRPIIRQFPFRITWLGPAVGVVGVVLWVGICWLNPEQPLVNLLGEENPLIMLLGLGPRPAFNPNEVLADQPAWVYWAFLVERIAGMSLFVPIAEELMLRGWLMRSFETDGYRPEFWQVPFGQASAATIVIGTAFPMLYHPEKAASLVWFTLVTWLMIRTKRFWDCVAAHAVTNFLLAIWVVTTGDWRLW